MAEGTWRNLAGDEWDVHSAGSAPSGFVHPLAIIAMSDVDIDISTQTSKHVSEFTDQSFDLVVTVCDGARESCPVFLGADRIEHWPFEDPAATTGSDDDRLRVFAAVRDQIRDRVAAYLRRIRMEPD